MHFASILASLAASPLVMPCHLKRVSLLLSLSPGAHFLHASFSPGANLHIDFTSETHFPVIFMRSEAHFPSHFPEFTHLLCILPSPETHYLHNCMPSDTRFTLAFPIAWDAFPLTFPCRVKQISILKFHHLRRIAFAISVLFSCHLKKIPPSPFPSSETYFLPFDPTPSVILPASEINSPFLTLSHEMHYLQDSMSSDTRRLWISP